MSHEEGQQVPEKLGCFWRSLSLLVALTGLYTAIQGELAFGGHALYLEGMQARIAGIVWMIMFLIPVLGRRHS